MLYPLDLEGASPDDYAEMADRLFREFGRLDGILHCAAEFRGLTPLEHTDPAAFARAVHVNQLQTIGHFEYLPVNRVVAYDEGVDAGNFRSDFGCRHRRL